MARRRNSEDEPRLFDLPLDPPPRARDQPAGRPAGGRERGAEAAAVAGPSTPAQPPLFPGDLDAGGGAAQWAAPAPDDGARSERLLPVEELHVSAGTRRALRRAPLSARWLAGLADLAIHLGVAVALLFGARLLGVRAGLGDWPALVVFLLVFSFLYHVLPLAFWGRTPGMAWAGLTARTGEGESLTFSQTARRWLGALVTLSAFGLPALLAFAGGRSLTDRVSGSETHLAP